MIDYVEIKTLFNIEKGSLQSSKYVEGEYDFVTASSEWKKHKEYTHDTEALIVAVAASGSLGRVHYVNGKFIASDLCFILTPKSKDLPVDLSFYYYIFKSIRDDLVKSTATGTSKLAINKTNFGNYKVPYVDIAKQKEYKKKLIHVAERKEKLTNVNCEQVSLIQNLRSQILQDAITGKLSEQWRKENPNIESAEILLGKIKAEKEKLIKEGKLKKQKPLSPIKEEEKPFDLPDGWVWCRLGEIIEYSENLDIHRYLPQDSIVNYVDIDSIDNSNQTIREIKQHSVNELSTRARRVLKKGYILYSTVRPYLRNIAVIDYELENFIGSTGFNVFRPLQINLKYVFNYLLTSYVNETFKKLMVGFNSPSITNEQFETVLIPLPPLDEQHHIVERIESLFTKLDRIKELNIDNQSNVDLINKVTLKELFY